jgi:hypothetical protein
MDRLDDVLKRLERCNAPITVRGKTYNGNNPYIINEINLLLATGALRWEEISIDGKIIKRMVSDDDNDYLFNHGLEEIANDNSREYNELLVQRQMERDNEEK